MVVAAFGTSGLAPNRSEFSIQFSDLSHLNQTLGGHGEPWRERRNRKKQNLGKLTILVVSDEKPVKFKMYLAGVKKFNLKVGFYFEKPRP